jgi:hypothetical protein
MLPEPWLNIVFPLYAIVRTTDGHDFPTIESKCFEKSSKTAVKGGGNGEGNVSGKTLGMYGQFLGPGGALTSNVSASVGPDTPLSQIPNNTSTTLPNAPNTFMVTKGLGERKNKLERNITLRVPRSTALRSDSTASCRLLTTHAGGTS